MKLNFFKELEKKYKVRDFRVIDKEKEKEFLENDKISIDNKHLLNDQFLSQPNYYFIHDEVEHIASMEATLKIFKKIREDFILINLVIILAFITIFSFIFPTVFLLITIIPSLVWAYYASSRNPNKELFDLILSSAEYKNLVYNQSIKIIK